MATRSVVTQIDVNGIFLATWTGLLQSSSDVGTAAGVPRCDILTFQLAGTLGTGGAVTLQGSQDNSTWGTLHTFGGADAVVDAIGEFVAVVEAPLYVRPSVTAGNGSTNLQIRCSGQTRR